MSIPMVCSLRAARVNFNVRGFGCFSSHFSHFCYIELHFEEFWCPTYPTIPIRHFISVLQFSKLWMCFHKPPQFRIGVFTRLREEINTFSGRSPIMEYL